MTMTNNEIIDRLVQLGVDLIDAKNLCSLTGNGHYMISITSWSDKLDGINIDAGSIRICPHCGKTFNGYRFPFWVKCLDDIKCGIIVCNNCVEIFEIKFNSVGREEFLAILSTDICKRYPISIAQWITGVRDMVKDIGKISNDIVTNEFISEQTQQDDILSDKDIEGLKRIINNYMKSRGLNLRNCDIIQITNPDELNKGDN